VWQERSEVALGEVAHWREEHPKATLAEIEQIIDAKIMALRASMIQETALASPTRVPATSSSTATCEQCGHPLQGRGQRKRTFHTQGGQDVTLHREYLTCSHCGNGVFPLDAELDLPPVCLLPHAHQALVRLGALLPFAQATEQLRALLDIRISTSTVRQHTEQAGRGSLAVQNEQAKPLALCPEETPAERMVMSADGAFVPLVGGQWGEVKLLAIGQVEVQEAVAPQCLPSTSTTEVSYFARLTDVSTFSEQASAEIRRRSLDRAKAVCAVQDGAEWLVGLTHSHQHDALRILDFAHAAQRIAAIRGTSSWRRDAPWKRTGWSHCCIDSNMRDPTS